MDPLTIATGAASLATTASTISIWLYTTINAIKNVDSKLTALSKEVTVLTGLLTSVENTIRKSHSQSLTLAHLDDQIWLQMDNTMMDCKITLEGLDRLVDKIRNDTGNRHFMKLLKKPSMHLKLVTQKDDISDFMDKVYKLNCALQTALAVVNISLAFRANTSQEMLFRELQSLKNFVEEAIVASHNPHSGTDPFAARLTRNLHSLAKSAQKFHSAASSTASTRYEGGRNSNTSSWGGSDFVRLNDTQRDRIERWKDQLQVVDEVQEDSATVTTEDTPFTDHSTVITTPDLEDKPRTIAEEVEEEDDDGSDDDDSDIELDFLKNFEELATASFSRKDYPKSEQFLRKAMERSTGESSSETDFKILRIRLAICCCLQDRWELAAGAVTPLSKSKAASNLPIFHLLQAISLGYLANDRFDDAHSVCKTALQGKKKILGKASDDFHECLSILASIYEKKGEPLEAEAVRLSIPMDWNPRSPGRISSGKEYILDHESLIDFAFGGKKSVDKTKASNPKPSPTTENDFAAYSGHWTTLVPNVRDGLQQAKKDEHAGGPVGETDTGKEFLNQTREELIPRRGTAMGVLRAINDEYSGKQLGEFDSGKEVTIDTPENGAFSKDKMTVSDAPRTPKLTTPVPNVTMVPSWPIPEISTWQSIQSRSKSNEGIVNNRSPDWYSTLEVVFQYLAPEYSTLELVSQISVPDMERQPMNRSIPRTISEHEEKLGRSPWNIDSAIDVRSQDSLITHLAVPLDTIPGNGKSSIPSPVQCSVGISLGLGDASFGMSRENGSMTLFEKETFDSGDSQSILPWRSISDFNDVWMDNPWNFLRMLLLHDEEGSEAAVPLFPAALISTQCPDWMDNFEAFSTTTKHLDDLETLVARWAGQVAGDDFASMKVKAIAVSVPDVLLRRAGKALSYRLGSNTLFKHAQLFPHSLAIAYMFIRSQTISLESFKLGHNHKTGSIIVLDCDDVLVECTSLHLVAFEDTHVVISPTQPATADLCGSLHAEIEFDKLVMKRLTAIMTRFRVKLAGTAIKAMTKACHEQFRKQIFPNFRNDGTKWCVDINIPQAFGVLEEQILEFDNETILQCFQPSMRNIRKMAIASILQLHDNGSLASHVLLAGKYASSRYLAAELRSAVTELGMGIMLLESPDGESAPTTGILNYLADVSLGL